MAKEDTTNHLESNDNALDHQERWASPLGQRESRQCQTGSYTQRTRKHIQSKARTSIKSPKTTMRLIWSTHPRDGHKNSRLARCVQGNFYYNLVSGLTNPPAEVTLSLAPPWGVEQSNLSGGRAADSLRTNT
jgi:hypothetical protein